MVTIDKKMSTKFFPACDKTQSHPIVHQPPKGANESSPGAEALGKFLAIGSRLL
jgi:hypothetical protein